MLSLADINAADLRIRPTISTTPCEFSETFSDFLGHRVYFKLENLHRTGSFKERGALNKLLTLNPQERQRGVICASAGNHAQGLAYHAQRLGIRCVVYMPEHAPITKVNATERFGAEVRLEGASFDEAVAAAREACQRDSLVFVHAFDDATVVAGQGTIGLELLRQNPELEAVVVPVGGGGLIGGIACALKEHNPKIQVIGVQTARVASLPAALAAGAPVRLPAAPTIADGIAVRQTGQITLPLAAKYLNSVVTVEEEEIASAILYLLEKEKTVAEGAGAAGLAALLHAKVQLRSRNTVVLICGGNIDPLFLSRIIERGLIKDGRLVRLRVNVPDRPGALHQLTGLFAKARANVITIEHDRAYHGVALGDTAIEATIETRGNDQVDAILAELSGLGYRIERIR
ncbi:MAG: threonine ammonia-lyase [Bryobacter sp.]|nr:threonine ammonia-lyase [Bryobacter sp.]